MNNRKFLLTTRPDGKKIPQGTECFEIINIPVTELKPVKSFEVSQVYAFDPDIAIFTSSYGAELYFDLFKGILSKKVFVVSIGKETELALSKRGVESIVPKTRTSTGIVHYLSQRSKPEDKVSLFVSSKSNRIIQSYLEKNGKAHQVNILYSSEPVSGNNLVREALKDECFGIIVTSSYEARTIFEDLLNSEEKAKICNRVKIFSIGKTTSEELKKLDVPVSFPEGESDLNKLITDIEKKYCASK